MEPDDASESLQPNGNRSPTHGPPRAAFTPMPVNTTRTPSLKELVSQFLVLVLTVFVTVRLLWVLHPVLASLFFYLAYRLGALRFITTCTVLVVGLGRRSALKEALRRCDTLPAPVTDKAVRVLETPDLRVAECSMQGWRRSMEDAHSLVPSLSRSDQRSSGDFAGDDTVSFFAVFDGHCGSTIAQFCGSSLHTFVANTPAFAEGDYETALREGFINADKHLAANPQFALDRSGSTAVAVMHVAPKNGVGKILCANAGDSRAVLCRGGRCIPLSFDHKPHSPTELRRIQAAKSFVWNRRVNGVLALSRAIGDFSFKSNSSVAWEEQAVTCVPEVKCLSVEPGVDEFIVLACDGIWDVMSSEDVVLFVRQNLMRGMAAKDVAERLVTSCLSPSPFGIGCDNMSVIILVFKDAAAFKSVA